MLIAIQFNPKRQHLKEIPHYQNDQVVNPSYFKCINSEQDWASCNLIITILNDQNLNYFKAKLEFQLLNNKLIV